MKLDLDVTFWPLWLMPAEACLAADVCEQAYNAGL